MEMEPMLARLHVEQVEGWRASCADIPALSFPKGWSIQIIPPFSGATVRFRARLGKRQASVYLDCHYALGCVGHPYWEVYPYKGDTGRCAMADTKTLMRMLRHTLTKRG